MPDRAPHIAISWTWLGLPVFVALVGLLARTPKRRSHPPPACGRKSKRDPLRTMRPASDAAVQRFHGYQIHTDPDNHAARPFRLPPALLGMAPARDGAQRQVAELLISSLKNHCLEKPGLADHAGAWFAAPLAPDGGTDAAPQDRHGSEPPGAAEEAVGQSRLNVPRTDAPMATHLSYRDSTALSRQFEEITHYKLHLNRITLAYCEVMLKMHTHNKVATLMQEPVDAETPSPDGPRSNMEQP